jgi:hypothetical protein
MLSASGQTETIESDQRSPALTSEAEVRSGWRTRRFVPKGDSDGFVAQIPPALVIRGASGGAVAWLAVEDPAHPWSPLPHQSISAGPFYLIWEHPERSGVTSEQWPYGVVRLTLAENPVHRWPQLAVPVSPPDATARRGQDVFLSQCLPCHRLKGGGAGEMGPGPALACRRGH